MKRNHLPESSQSLHEDQEIVSSRLIEIFKCSDLDSKARRIPIQNKGYWIAAKRHVKLDNPKLAANVYAIQMPDDDYLSLRPFEALLCMECSNLLIYHMGAPLSLAEAFELLLDCSSNFDMKRYRVFQQLNRSGFICLPHDNSSIDPEYIKTKVKDGTTTATKNITLSSVFGSNLNPIQERLIQLREVGPKALTVDDIAEESMSIDLPEISFDVYIREHFHKNKPRKGCVGSPDYHLVVCDKDEHSPPSWLQLLEWKRRHKLESNKLMFAIVDQDLSMCFSQFKTGASNCD